MPNDAKPSLTELIAQLAEQEADLRLGGGQVAIDRGVAVAQRKGAAGRHLQVSGRIAVQCTARLVARRRIE